MADDDKPAEGAAKIPFDVQIDKNLWNQIAPLVDRRMALHPNVGDVYTVAATLMHLAASAWGLVVPSEATRQLGIHFDEERFVHLAKSVWAARKTRVTNT